MKKTGLISFLFMLTPFFVLGQASEKEPQHSIGFSLMPLGQYELVQKQTLCGAPGYHGKEFYVLGMYYKRPFTKRLSWQVGFDYGHYTVRVSPNLPPGSDMPAYDKDFSLLSIPVSLSVDICDYLYISAGMIFDFDNPDEAEMPDMAGFGFFGAAGVQYEFANHVIVFVSPYLSAHSLVSWEKSNHYYLPESGLKFGFSFSPVF